MYPSPLFESNLSSLPLLARGKVRDIYAVDQDKLLIVTTDRLSAFDVVLPDPIPGKGRVLTALANFWFQRLGHIVPNQLTGIAPESVVRPDEREQVQGRALVVKRLMPLPIEAVVRGYLIGSGWEAYKKSGAVCGVSLPPGLRQAERLPFPLFTPASKAAHGEHDENISFEEAQTRCAESLSGYLQGSGTNGASLVEQARRAALMLYESAATYALGRGIVIADTKFEFGVDRAGRLHLIDEALTPDSSRFWPLSEYEIGHNPPSFDKQYIRDYLETLDWGKCAPGPGLPTQVLSASAEKYHQAYIQLTGEHLF